MLITTVFLRKSGIIQNRVICVKVQEETQENTFRQCIVAEVTKQDY